MPKYGNISYSKMPWYNSYRSMIHRCYNPNAKNYKYYGGRGINVCDDWKSIEKFAKWADETYETGKSLDRIDNDSDYSPDNCRWSSPKEQCNNRRSCVVIEYNGESHTLSEWARLYDVPPKVVILRHWKGIKPPELFEKREAYKNGVAWTKGKTWIIENGRRKWQ